jgi:hypothetical protein
VDAAKVKTRLESAAAAAGLTGAPLEVVMNIEIYQKDILISGKVVNNSDKALRNVHLMVSFLDINRLTINTESTTLATREDLAPVSAVPFNLVGRNLLGRTSYVAWEIPALELAKPTAIPAVEDNPPGPEPEKKPK